MIRVFDSSRFLRRTCNLPKPVEHPVAVVTVVRAGVPFVLVVCCATLRKLEWWLKSSWNIPKSEVGLVRKKSGFWPKLERSAGWTGQSVMSSWPAVNALNIVWKSEWTVMRRLRVFGP